MGPARGRKEHQFLELLLPPFPYLPQARLPLSVVVVGRGEALFDSTPGKERGEGGGQKKCLPSSSSFLSNAKSRKEGKSVG